MLDYRPGFTAAGGAAGGGIGASLGQLLAPLAYPREALWNLPGKLAEGDIVGALPGLLGAGATAGLAATGVGLPLALLGGAALGGIGQGVGRAVDEQRFAAPTGADLVRALGGDPTSWPGWAAGMGAEMIGDPLSYAGGLGGAAKGGQYGSHLTDVALTRGPRFPGGLEKLAPWYESTDPVLLERAKGIAWSPYRKEILNEIAPSSNLLGLGVEATGVRAPEGYVTRIAGGPGTVDASKIVGSSWLPNTPESLPPAAAPVLPPMIRPARDITIGPYRIQHTPFVDMLKEGADEALRGAEWEKAGEALKKASVQAGYSPWDLHLGNLGKTPAGRYVITDPGAVSPFNPMTPIPEPIRSVQGSRLDNLLLDLLGSDRAIRRAIPADLARGLPTQGIPVPGAAEFTEAEMRRRLAQAALRTNLVPPTGGF